ncbi:MAG: hypothetical protein ACYDHB_04420 [Candidatus Dormibacteria bacterium]
MDTIQLGIRLPADLAARARSAAADQAIPLTQVVANALELVLAADEKPPDQSATAPSVHASPAALDLPTDLTLRVVATARAHGVSPACLLTDLLALGDEPPPVGRELVERTVAPPPATEPVGEVARQADLLALTAQVSELVGLAARLTERLESPSVGATPAQAPEALPSGPAPVGEEVANKTAAAPHPESMEAPLEPVDPEHHLPEEELALPDNASPGVWTANAPYKPLPGFALSPIPAVPYGAPPWRPPAFDRPQTQVELDRIREAAIALLPPESFEDAGSDGEHLTAPVLG